MNGLSLQLLILSSILLIAWSQTSKAEETADFLIDQAAKLNFKAEVYHKKNAPDFMRSKIRSFYSATPPLTGENIVALANVYQDITVAASTWHTGIAQFPLLVDGVDIIKDWYSSRLLETIEKKELNPVTFAASSIAALMLPWYTKKPLVVLYFQQEKLSKDSFTINPDLTVTFYGHNKQAFFSRSETPDVLLYIDNRMVYLTFNKQKIINRTEASADMTEDYSRALEKFVSIIEKALISSDDSRSSRKVAQPMAITSSEGHSDAVYLLPGGKGFTPVTATFIQSLPNASSYIMSCAMKYPNERNYISCMVSEFLQLSVISSQAQHLQYARPSAEFLQQLPKAQVGSYDEEQNEFMIAGHLHKLRLTEEDDFDNISCFDRNIKFIKYFYRYTPELIALLETLEETAETETQLDATSAIHIKEQVSKINDAIEHYADQPSVGSSYDIEVEDIRMAYFLQRFYWIKNKLKITRDYTGDTQYRDKLNYLMNLEIQEVITQEDEGRIDMSDFSILAGVFLLAGDPLMQNVYNADQLLKIFSKRLKASSHLAQNEFEIFVQRSKVTPMLANLESMYILAQKFKQTKDVQLFIQKIKNEAAKIHELIFSTVSLHDEMQSANAVLALKIITAVGSSCHKKTHHSTPDEVLSWDINDLQSFWNKHGCMIIPKKEVAVFLQEHILFILECFKDVISKYDCDIQGYSGHFINLLNSKFSINHSDARDIWLAFSSQFEFMLPTPEVTKNTLEAIINAPPKELIKRAQRLVGSEEQLQQLANQCAQAQLSIEGGKQTIKAAKNMQLVPAVERNMLTKQFMTNSQVVFRDSTLVIQGAGHEISFSSPVLKAIKGRDINTQLTLLCNQRQWNLSSKNAEKYEQTNKIKKSSNQLALIWGNFFK